ncbi:MAG: hypothetical protein ABSF71_32740 [Terriglobia bacterium]|jgi:hypothetical protein
MEPENSEDEFTSFGVVVSTDRDQFFRLTCPSCGRDFKVLIDPTDLQWALGSYCQRMGYNLEPKNRDQAKPTRIHCPYCTYEDQTVEMHTDETVTYLKRFVYRELAIPRLNELASALEETVGGARQSGGLFQISVEFMRSRIAMPVRPIHGPEPPDFKIVTFLCCGKKVKISEGWTGVRNCTFCGCEVMII